MVSCEGRVRKEKTHVHSYFRMVDSINCLFGIVLYKDTKKRTLVSCTHRKESAEDPEFGPSLERRGCRDLPQRPSTGKKLSVLILSFKGTGFASFAPVPPVDPLMLGVVRDEEDPASLLASA